MANVYLIGVRGIPNRYGGFERLVEVLAPHLVRQGHNVTVFCNQDPTVNKDNVDEDLWMGVRRRFISVRSSGPLGTIEYDWRSFKEVPENAVALIFGYGTGVFQRYLKQRSIPHAVNMDGIEWRREKWGRLARIWLRMNERSAARQADILIADHPEIQRYLQEELGKESTMIAYGVDDDALQPGNRDDLSHPLLTQYPSQSFSLVVARPEPENQIHVILEAFERSEKKKPMVVLGNFEINDYGRQLRTKYTDVHFAGGVYNTGVLNELRRRSNLYIHGHSVGGTNPSLIEAMAAGALLLAHDNPFNRWVLGGDTSGLFFKAAADLAAHLDNPPDPTMRTSMIHAAQQRCVEQFLWSRILSEYDAVLARLQEAMH
ncbi:MAG: glycosyltransferase family 1 protein [Chloroflexi bacterium]|nr:glycosyltransferase family 1 protein [Chloroflexota bacterium]